MLLPKNLKRIETEISEGIKVHGIYWTLGKYDAVAIFEAPDEKTAMENVDSSGRGYEYGDSRCGADRRSEKTC